MIRHVEYAWARSIYQTFPVCWVPSQLAYTSMSIWSSMICIAVTFAVLHFAVVIKMFSNGITNKIAGNLCLSLIRNFIWPSIYVCSDLQQWSYADYLQIRVAWCFLSSVHFDSSFITECCHSKQGRNHHLNLYAMSVPLQSRLSLVSRIQVVLHPTDFDTRCPIIIELFSFFGNVSSNVSQDENRSMPNI